ncbi:MAG: helix-turn-helix domain-containing protein [Pseudomonadota bacterium]
MSLEIFPLRMRTIQAAEYTGLSPRTFEKLRLSGDGPIYAKIGRAVIYERADLDAWLAAHKRASTSDLGGV